MTAVDIRSDVQIPPANRSLIRAALLLLGLPQLAVGLWAVFDPHSWFVSFPGAGQHWLPVFGPYNAHLAGDVGAAFVGLGVLMILAAYWAERHLVQVAAIAYLAFQVPHFVYHLREEGLLSVGGDLANDILLGVTVLIAAWLLYASRSPGPPRAVRTEGLDTTPDKGVGRLRSRRRGPLASTMAWFARRQYGRRLDPLDAFLQHVPLMLGYGAFEAATKASRRVEERLKLLAEVRAAALVRCEWCVDFGSWLSLRGGVSEAQLRELSHYRESDAFDDLEKLVLDYATAVSRTPADVDEQIFARLREHFDDAQLVELTSVIALENYRARFNAALGLTAQGFSDDAVCALPEPSPQAAAQ